VSTPPFLRRGNQLLTLIWLTVHFAPWYRNKMRMPVADTLKEVIEPHTGLEIPAEYITEEEALEKYLERAYGGQYDFTQTA
jgi:hypothetical protein